MAEYISKDDALWIASLTNAPEETKERLRNWIFTDVQPRDRGLNGVLFSSAKCEWETPQDLFDKLNKEFHFTVDVCALPENAKCEKYFTPEMDGLAQCWEGVCWCNPPYGREISKWVIKAKTAQSTGATIVMLLPARTDTKWFHDYIYNGWNTEIRFIKGRLKFGGVKNCAPFPSMIVIFRKGEK